LTESVVETGSFFYTPLHPFSCPTLPHEPRSRKGYLGLLQRNFIILSALKT
jgi:hypothetical protein